MIKLKENYDRQGAIERLKQAFDNEELGAQKGAETCSYYDGITDSYCAVGILIGKDEALVNSIGDITAINGFIGINLIMATLRLDSFCGLTMKELCTLQAIHDSIITDFKVDYNSNLNMLKEYIFSLT